MDRVSLTVFRLKQSAVDREFGQLLGHASAQPFDVDGMPQGVRAAGFLRVSPADDEPQWALRLRMGLAPGLPPAPTAAPAAVIFIQAAVDAEQVVFAACFGATGRYLVDQMWFSRGWGLRTALSLLHVDDRPEQLRKVAVRTVSDNTLRTDRQASKVDSFDRFGVDRLRDLLSTVQGRPKNAEQWGTTIRGSVGVGVRVRSLADLADQCVDLERSLRSDNYKNNFGWIDHVREVTDPALLDGLRSTLVALLRDGSVDDLELAIPEHVDDFSAIAFHYARRGHEHLSLATYVQALADQADRETGKTRLETLTSERLKSQKVKVLDAVEGGEARTFRVFDCITGELKHAGATYVVDGGSFYEVDKDFQDQLLAELRELLRLNETELPESTKAENEGPYNERASNSEPDYLCMDKRTVKISTRASPIEVCDILTVDGRLIHVKRKLGSSSLSHLFAQGSVSARLLADSREFRLKTRETVRNAVRERDPAFPLSGGHKDVIGRDKLRPPDHRVVYAIVADFRGKGPIEALPFFSKVNLRRHAQDLVRRGFIVELRAVDAK
jgi:uncharacterized protein (TIGR04141 family)